MAGDWLAGRPTSGLYVRRRLACACALVGRLACTGLSGACALVFVFVEASRRGPLVGRKAGWGVRLLSGDPQTHDLGGRRAMPKGWYVRDVKDHVVFYCQDRHMMTVCGMYAALLWVTGHASAVSQVLPDRW